MESALNPNNLPYATTDIKPPNSVHPLIMVLLLLFFPPIAWYLMFKNAEYHKWFVYLLWLSGAIFLLGFGAQLIFLLVEVPRLQAFYTEFDAIGPNIFPLLVTLIGTALFGAGIIWYGYYLKSHLQQHLNLSRKQVGIAVLWLIVTYTIAVILRYALIISATIPLYNLKQAL